MSASTFTAGLTDSDQGPAGVAVRPERGTVESVASAVSFE
jgi:hypothetical protein